MKIKNIPFSLITLLLLSVSISLFLYNGIGLSDTNEYTTFLYRALDKSYLKNDWFVNINEGTFNVRSYFIGLIQLVLLIIPSIPLVYFLLFLVTISLAGLSTYLISHELFKNQKISIFNSFLILIGATFALGGNLMIYGYLLSFGLSFSISLLGFYFLLKKRLFLYSLLLGLAVLVHFMWGHLIFAVLFCASLFARIKDNHKIKSTMPHSGISRSLRGARDLNARKIFQRISLHRDLRDIEQISCAQDANSTLKPQDLENLDGHQKLKIFERWSFRKHLDIKNYIAAFFIFLLFSMAILPIVFWQAKLGASLSGEEIAQILGHIRAPHHYMPFEWDITRYVEFVLFFLVFLVAFKEVKIDSFNKNLIKIAIWLLFLGFFIGTIFVEIFPISVIIKMHLFRLSTFLVFIEYLFIGAYTYQNLQQSKVKETLKFIFYIAFSISLFSNHLILFSAPAFFIFYFLQPGLIPRGSASAVVPSWKIKNTPAPWVGWDFYFLGRKIKLKGSKIILFALPLFLIMLILGILFYKPLFILLQAKISRIILFLFKIMLFIPLCAAILFDKKIIKIMFVCSILISSMIFILAKPSFFYISYDGATENLYRFIKEYTDKDAIFLTPPSLHSFRLGAQRAIVVDFKSFPFGEKEMLEWLNRIRAVSNYPNFNNKNQQASELINKGYKSLSEEDIIKIQKQYNFSYIVSEKPNFLNFKKKYENTNYILYEVIAGNR